MHSHQRGYTYFGVLFVVALIALALTGASLIIQVERQREKEQQLLFIGQQYVNAIASYYDSAPGGNKRYPRTIAELLLDPRFPTIKRHLRKPWLDPFTLSKQWGIVRTKQGGIAGIYSLGQGKPFKRAGFANATLEKLLADKNRYQDWKFLYIASTDEMPRAKPADAKNDSDSDQANAGETEPTAAEQNSEDGQENPVENPDEGAETGAELLPAEEGTPEAGSIQPAETN